MPTGTSAALAERLIEHIDNRTMHSHLAGCPDCEYERLRKWALSQKIIDPFTGPEEVVSTVIRLVENMSALLAKQ